jgi:SagB-type dehydrogenase family enzyme
LSRSALATRPAATDHPGVRRDLLLILAGGSLMAAACGPAASPPSVASSLEALPSPVDAGERSLEEVLAERRSVRQFDGRSVDRADLAQLLWAAQGVTDAHGHRTAPSAGGLYPLELYVVDAAGVWRYVADEHGLLPVVLTDVRAELTAAAGQECVADADTIVVVTGIEARTRVRYGDRAERYVWLEAGHAAQNLLLQATALGLGAVPVGAFDDAAVARALELADGERPLYLVPVGHPSAR